MQRLVILTVGKTHSGKTTFARALEQTLHNALVIDQDHHAGFINTYYKRLLPDRGPNTLKYAITQTIVDYAIRETNYHLILCNAYRDRESRIELLNHFHQLGFRSVLVHFSIPEHILRERIAHSARSTAIFRSATTFEDVLNRQFAEDQSGAVKAPSVDETHYYFEIKSPEEVQMVIQEITTL